MNIRLINEDDETDFVDVNIDDETIEELRSQQNITTDEELMIAIRKIIMDQFENDSKKD